VIEPGAVDLFRSRAIEGHPATMQGNIALSLPQFCHPCCDPIFDLTECLIVTCHAHVLASSHIAKRKERASREREKRGAPSLPALGAGGLPAFRPTLLVNQTWKKLTQRSSVIGSSLRSSCGLAPQPRDETLILCSAGGALIAHRLKCTICFTNVDLRVRVAALKR